MNLNEQFQAAADRVNNLPPDAAAAHMTELYGLFKQATDGDVNMKSDQVSATEANQADGPTGLSQAQWDSWNQFKGMPEEEAMRQYVSRAAEIAGGGADSAPAAQPVSTDAATNAPSGPANATTENTTTANQPDHGPGQTTGGLRGDITAGAPYGGEDKLKGEQ